MTATEAQLTSARRFSEERSADLVAGSFAEAPDLRLREVLQSLVRHLHAFAKDVALIQPELDEAIDFLTRTGQMCDETRQEFILLFDVLGLSMLVDSLTNRTAGGATESTVLGPFHMVTSPRRSLGDSLMEVPGGEPAVVTGRALSTDGTAMAGAWVDVWSADGDGCYDVQRSDVPVGHLRGLFACEPDGRFRFTTVLPSPYRIPTDGPVGQLLAATGRLPWRPAHLHFQAGAPGHATLTTHVFVKGSPYLDTDAVFGVKDSLVVDFDPHADIELRLNPL